MPDQRAKRYSILLAGGTGSRLWPVSRELFPKQLVSFIGEDSLVQSTAKRLLPVLDPEGLRIVCGQEHFHEIARHLEEIGISSEGKILCEPCGRNTAPAILLAVLEVLQKEKDAVIFVFPADHVVRDIQALHRGISSAGRLAEKGHIVTFGIKPHYPETGYGYIESAGEVSEGAMYIKRFVEKPDVETAGKYLEAGNYFWNSGMFSFKATVILEEFRRFSPDLLERMQEIVSGEMPISGEGYGQLPSISFDYTIMEKTQRGVILPSDFGWSDIGSWKSLYDFLPKNEQGNIIDGDVVAQDTANCFIMGHERLIATNHLRDMVVVETPDSVFVSDMDCSRDVKSIVAGLKEKGRKEYYQHKTRHHVWGSSTVLERREDYSVIRNVLYPGMSFTLTADRGTIKHLAVTRGAASITTDAGKRDLLRGDNSVVFQSNSVLIENTGTAPLCVVEVTSGD